MSPSHIICPHASGPCPEGTSLGWHLQVACGPPQAAGPFLERGGCHSGAVSRLLPPLLCSYRLSQVKGLTFLKWPVCGDSLLELGVLLAEHLGCPGTSFS